MAREFVPMPSHVRGVSRRRDGYANRTKTRPTPRIKLVSEELQAHGGLPTIRERRGTRFIFYGKQLAEYISWQLIATLLLVLFGSLGALAINAQITNATFQISQAQTRLVNYQGETFALEALLRDRYTIDQIERIAIERLGMTHPDPAQIIDIYVPLQRTVRLNMDEDVLPAQNFLLENLRTFLTGVLDSIFGG